MIRFFTKLQVSFDSDIIKRIRLEAISVINTIKDLWYAITSPEKYREFMNYKTGKLLLYVLVLTFLSSIFTIGIPSVQFLKDGGIQKIVDEQIPEFRMSEEGFWIEHPVEIDEYDFFIKANSDIVYEDITDVNGAYGTYECIIAVDREQIYMKTPNTPEVMGRFDELKDFSFTKADLSNYIPVMYMAIAFLLVMSFLVDYGYYFVTAFVVSWAAGIFTSFMKIKINNKKMFKMAVYAGTLSYILQTIQIFIGKYIPNFALFSLIISAGYMYFAIRDYRDQGIEELPPEPAGKYDRED